MHTRSTTKRTWLATGACLILAGYGSSASHAALIGSGAGSPLDTDRDSDWRRVATVADRARLRGWRGAWMDALAQVDAKDLAAEPILFDPDHALADALPPAGSYQCRTFKLGARGGIGPTYSASAWFACRIDSNGDTDVVSLVKVDGSQRPVGTVFVDTASRAIFLGTMELGDEKRPMRYGRDANRDMAGLIERIGTRRWRVVLPYPRFESVLDVVELIPAP